MNTSSRYLVFVIQDWATVVAYQPEPDDPPEPICTIRAGMTLEDLQRAVEDWEEQ